MLVSVTCLNCKVDLLDKYHLKQSSDILIYLGSSCKRIYPFGELHYMSGNHPTKYYIGSKYYIGRMYQSGGELHCAWENVSQVKWGTYLILASSC